MFSVDNNQRFFWYSLIKKIFLRSNCFLHDPAWRRIDEKSNNQQEEKQDCNLDNGTFKSRTK